MLCGRELLTNTNLENIGSPENGLVKNELVVFGDHTNDIKMFQIADRRIAVKNAIIELKQQATHIIESNQSDGVVKYIENDWTNGE